MMSASAISAAIRAKKKKMEDEESGAVKLSGIPIDATDTEVEKMKEEGERLSENVPKEHDEEPALAVEEHAEEAAEPHEDSEKEVHMMAEGGVIEESPEEKLKRHAKIKMMLSKMGK